MNTYRIETIEPAPSMNHKAICFFGTYAKAVAAAHRSWRKTGRSTFVYAHYGTTAYHMVVGGVATDTNSGSGIPARQQLSEWSDADEDDEIMRDYDRTIEDFLAGTGRV